MKEKDVRRAAKEGKEKISRLRENIPKALIKMWEDILTMVAMLHDYVRGRYTEVPWYIITSIASAVAYFVAPLDVIPDVLPGLGYLDDAIVITLATDIARKDLKKYREWKKSLTVH